MYFLAHSTPFHLFKQSVQCSISVIMLIDKLSNRQSNCGKKGNIALENIYILYIFSNKSWEEQASRKILTLTATCMDCATCASMHKLMEERAGRLIKNNSSQNTNLGHWINCWSQMKHRLHQLSSNLYWQLITSQTSEQTLTLPLKMIDCIVF